MTHWIIPPDGLIEPCPAPEFYSDGYSAVELVGDCARFYLTCAQMPLEAAGGVPQQVVVVKIVKPLRSLPGVLVNVAHCLWGDDPRHHAPHGFKPRLVT